MQSTRHYLAVSAIVALFGAFGLGYAIYQLSTGGLSPRQQTAAVGDTTTGLVAHWAFNEGSGTSVADTAGSANGTLSGSVIPTWTSGPSGMGSALSFDGTNSYVTLPTNSALNFGSADYSISMWVQSPGRSGGLNGLMALVFGIDVFPTDLSPAGAIRSGSVYGGSSFFGSAWHHVAVVKNSGTCSIYLDTTLSASGSCAGAADYSTGQYIGSIDASPSRPYLGYIDDVRAYSRALSSDDRLALFNMGGGDQTVPTVSLSAGVSSPVTQGTSVSLQATASDNIGVAGVSFQIDSTQIADVTSAPYIASWNTSSASAGSHTIYAVARDAAGNRATTTLSFTINANSSVTTISNVAASAGQTGATITWSTDRPTDGIVDYGTTASYGSQSTLVSTLSTSHTIILSGLSQSTTYHYRVRSTDSNAVASTSGDYTFTTAGAVVSTTDIYITQDGTDQGVCTGSHSISWANDSANWGSGAGKIAPGTTIHLCGTFTSKFKFVSSGTIGNPITLKFEQNAKFSAPSWTTVHPNLGIVSAGDLSGGTINNIVIDGGTNGIIEATDNGVLLGHNDFIVAGVFVAGSNVEVKNLTVRNLYVMANPHSPAPSMSPVVQANCPGATLYTTPDCDNDGGIALQTMGSANGIYYASGANAYIHDNIVDNASNGIYSTFGPSPYNVVNLNIYNNTVRNISWAILVGGGGNNNNERADQVNIYNNRISDEAQWSTWFWQYNPDAGLDPGWDHAHNNGIYLFARNNATITNARVHGNIIGGNWSESNTADIFILDGVNDSYFYNNLMFDSGGLNGYITFGGHNNVIANNTIIGSGAGTGIQTGPYGQTGQVNMGNILYNNIIYNVGTPIYFDCHDYVSTTIQCVQAMRTAIASSENNLFYRSPSYSGGVLTFGEGWSLTEWRQYLGFDTNSAIGNPLFVNEGAGNYRLQSGSPGRGLAQNMLSYFTTDIAGATRRSGLWDVGAYQYDSTPIADTTAPTVPLNLAVTNVTSSLVTIDWDASTDAGGAVTGYKIYRATGNGSALYLAQTASTFYTDTSVDPSTSYTYSVSAIDGSNNESDKSVSQTATTPGSGQSSLTFTSSPSVINIGQNSATISWNTSLSLSSASVSYGLTSSYGSVATDPVPAATSHSVALSGLQADTVYHYSVSATSGGSSIASNDATFTTSAVPVPPPQPSGGGGGGGGGGSSYSSTYLLTAVKKGTGTGSITSFPSGILCGSLCLYAFGQQTTVTLTAAPTSNSKVVSWKGCDSVLGAICTVKMTAVRAVEATFDLLPGAAPLPSTARAVDTAIASVSGTAVTKALSLGASDTQVKSLQQILNKKGYTVAVSGNGSVGNESTYFGPATEKALKKFQCAVIGVCSGSATTNGYGLTGPKTRAALGGSSASAAVPVASTKPATTVQPTPSKTTAETPIAGIPPGSTFSRVLKIGSVGSDVKALQVFLNNSGFRIASSGNGSPGKESTYYGAATAAAVARFQERYAADVLTPYGLAKGTGIVGKATLIKLNALNK